MNTHKNIDTVCPYCGSGCVITCTVDTETNRVIEAKGSPEGVNNEGRLCLKGLYGWDYLNDPQILTKRIRHPMIRKGGKQSPLVEVSWQEAIEYTASRLKAIIKEYGPDAVMGAGSARGPGNETAYIMGFTLLSWQRLRNNKPPAMRVCSNSYTKKSPFPYNRGVQATIT